MENLTEEQRNKIVELIDENNRLKKILDSNKSDRTIMLFGDKKSSELFLDSIYNIEKIYKRHLEIPFNEELPSKVIESKYPNYDNDYLPIDFTFEIFKLNKNDSKKIEKVVKLNIHYIDINYDNVKVYFDDDYYITEADYYKKKFNYLSYNDKMKDIIWDDVIYICDGKKKRLFESDILFFDCFLLFFGLPILNILSIIVNVNSLDYNDYHKIQNINENTPLDYVNDILSDRKKKCFKILNKRIVSIKIQIKKIFENFKKDDIGYNNFETACVNIKYYLIDKVIDSELSVSMIPQIPQNLKRLLSENVYNNLKDNLGKSDLLQLYLDCKHYTQWLRSILDNLLDKPIRNISLFKLNDYQKDLEEKSIIFEKENAIKIRALEDTMEELEREKEKIENITKLNNLISIYSLLWHLAPIENVQLFSNELNKSRFENRNKNENERNLIALGDGMISVCKNLTNSHTGLTPQVVTNLASNLLNFNKNEYGYFQIFLEKLQQNIMKHTLLEDMKSSNIKECINLFKNKK